MPTQRHPFVFDSSSGAWVEDYCAPAASAEHPAAITVATWNTWFAPYYFEPRFRALLEVVRACQEERDQRRRRL